MGVKLIQTVLRWIAFIPVGIVLVFLIEGLTSGLFVWLFSGNIKMFIIVCILFGGLFTVIPLYVMLICGAVNLAVLLICPGPRVGAIIFGTLYYLIQLNAFVAMFLDEDSGGAGIIVPMVIFQLVSMIAVGISLTAIYRRYRDQSKQSEMNIESEESYDSEY